MHTHASRSVCECSIDVQWGAGLLQDPVDGAPAVLVKLYNVTQQKHMEAELQTQKEALARSAMKPPLLHEPSF